MGIASSLFLFYIPFYIVSADSSILIDSTTYLYGNVKFINDKWNISSRTGIITKDKVTANDSVSITKDSLIIHTNWGEYFWNNEIRLYNGFVACKTYETLTGDNARYFGDKIWVTGNIEYINSKENWLVRGGEGFYDADTRFITITESPKFESPQDSIEIVGDTLKLLGDTLTKVIHNAVIKLTNTQCFADSLIYLPKSNKAILYGNPLIVAELDSLKGEQVEILLSEKKISQILVQGQVSGKRWKF